MQPIISKLLPAPVRKNSFRPGDIVIHAEKRIMGEVVVVSGKWVKIKVLKKKTAAGGPVYERYAFQHMRVFMNIEQRLEMVEKVKKQKNSLRGRLAGFGDYVKRKFSRRAG